MKMTKKNKEPVVIINWKALIIGGVGILIGIVIAFLFTHSLWK